MGYWLLLILAMMAFGGGLNWLFAGNYAASTPMLLLAILLVMLAIAIRITRKGKS